MKTKILVIEDVPEMAELICMYLNNADFESLAFDTAEKALEKLSAGYSPALVILDLNLPGMSGFDFLKTFRKNYKATIPVIILSARDADEDIIEGLGFGADEFVTKPFSPKVLVARVQSKLARLCATEASVEETINFGPYTLYCNSCILKKRTEKIPLSTKEYEVLEFLISHENEVKKQQQASNAGTSFQCGMENSVRRHDGGWSLCSKAKKKNRGRSCKSKVHKDNFRTWLPVQHGKQ